MHTFGVQYMRLRAVHVWSTHTACCRRLIGRVCVSVCICVKCSLLRAYVCSPARTTRSRMELYDLVLARMHRIQTQPYGIVYFTCSWNLSGCIAVCVLLFNRRWPNTHVYVCVSVCLLLYKSNAFWQKQTIPLFKAPKSELPITWCVPAKLFSPKFLVECDYL